VGATLDRLVDMDEILYGGDDVGYYFYYMLFNPVSLTVPKWLTLKLLRWVLIFNRLVDMDGILYGGDDVQYYFDYILFNLVS
jgi:hypothetical protein